MALRVGTEEQESVCSGSTEGSGLYICPSELALAGHGIPDSWRTR